MISISKISAASLDIQDLYQNALQGRKQAYCSYSGHAVGAAIRTSDGLIYSGCNIENASFGATICAERVAIQKAVSEKGKIEITEVMVVTNATPPWPPCGMCRQVIAEFGKSTVIYSANTEGHFETIRFEVLFPYAFSSSNLAERP